MWCLCAGNKSFRVYHAASETNWNLAQKFDAQFEYISGCLSLWYQDNETVGISFVFYDNFEEFFKTLVISS